MTQKRRRRSKQWVSRLIILFLVVVAVMVCYLVWNAYFKDKGERQPKQGESSTIVVDDKKKEEKETKKEEEKPKEEVVEKEKIVQYDGDDPNEAGELTGVLTYAGVVNGNLMIRVNIDQYLNGGKCTLGLRREGATIYSAEAGIIDSASTATCEGFNVPVSELGQGQTVIWIFLESDGKTGEIDGEVTL